MKKQILLGSLALVLAVSAQATIFYQGNLGSYTGNTPEGSVAHGTIVDGNPVGTVNQMDLSGAGLGSGISSINVILNLSGGYNGDLYGYLTYNGVAVVLLNRVGVTSSTPFGNSGSSMNVLLSDSGTANIHNPVNGLANQTYNVDNNQNVNPAAGASDFISSSVGSLGSFGGANPNGPWALFLADMSGGGGDTTLLGWGLDITVVPEPTTWALLGFVALLAGGKLVSLRRRTV